MDWQSSCADLKKLPHYNAIMKSFLFKHIKEMLTELFTEVGEEALILSVNPVTGAMSRLGTIAGQAFLEDRDPLLSQFLSFCVKRTSKYTNERENIRKGKRKAVEITIESPNPAKIQKKSISKTLSANENELSDLEIKDKLESKIKDRLTRESNETDTEIGNGSPESAADKSLLKNASGKSSNEKAGVSPSNENENTSLTSNQNVSLNENTVKRNSNDKNEAKCKLAKNSNRQEICSQEKQPDLGEKDRPERQSSVESSSSEDQTSIPTKVKMKGREQLSTQVERQTRSTLSNEGMNVSDYEIKREIDINDYEAGFNGNDEMEWSITVNNPDSTASDVTQDYDLNITGYDEKSLVENEIGVDKGGPDILKNSKKNKTEVSRTEIPSATATSSQISTEEEMKVDLDMVKIEPVSPSEPLSDEDIPTGELSEEDIPARNTPCGSKDSRTTDDNCFDEYLKEGHTEMDKSLDVSRTVKEDIVCFIAKPHNSSLIKAVVSGVCNSTDDIKTHSCKCGYYTKDKSNYNKHAKKCKWHGPSKSTKSTPAKQAPSTSTSQAETSQSTTSGNAPLSYICDSCGKQYKSKYGLKLHIKTIHERNFKHKCSICNKTFNQTVQYRYHMSKHLKEKMDTCQHCKQSFTAHGSLARHLKTSCSSNREQGSFETFNCDQCCASFRDKNRLLSHKQGKHGEKRYTCEGCNKAFAWRSSLSVHRRLCRS